MFLNFLYILNITDSIDNPYMMAGGENTGPQIQL